ncbi:MAG: hypothetical protein MR346_11215 [Clostridium sp.]|nr:hypothetical protein [Clostridium sp.]
MTISNVVGIISVVCALISTICAIVSNMNESNCQRRLDEEKHKMAQAKFCCIEPNIGGRKISYKIKNQGVNPVSDIKIDWAGAVKPKQKTINFSKLNSDNYDFEIVLDFSDTTGKVKGEIIIVYKDIYNNECKSKKKIELFSSENNYDDKMFYNE